jgi:hypothetical protein
MKYEEVRKCGVVNIAKKAKTKDYGRHENGMRRNLRGIVTSPKRRRKQSCDRWCGHVIWKMKGSRSETFWNEEVRKCQTADIAKRMMEASLRYQ